MFCYISNTIKFLIAFILNKSVNLITNNNLQAMLKLLTYFLLQCVYLNNSSYLKLKTKNLVK